MTSSLSTLPELLAASSRESSKAVDRLERFPLSGSIVPELRREEFREILLKKYRIIYRVRSEERVEIVTVHHGARLLDLDLFLVD